MRQAILFWLCDVCEEAESPSGTDWRNARRLADADGWMDSGDDTHICPSCQAEMTKKRA